MEVEMFPKVRFALGFALLISLVLAVPAFAGGWAVITLDELPTDVRAGEPLTIGFTVLQHGKTPMDGLDPTVTATLPRDEQFVVQAEPDGKPGHYTATLTFPKEGNWEWSIQAFSMDQPMPGLAVAAPKVASAHQPVSDVKSTPAAISLLMLFRALVFGAALAALVLAIRRKSRPAGAFAGLCLVVGVTSVWMGGSALVVGAQGQSPPHLSVKSSSSQAELGRQLFIAKGCITCHYNDRAARRNQYWTVEMGAPDLSTYSASPEVLFIRLKDPRSAKSDTKMPNLELKKTEIEALIAFLNSK